MGIFAVCLQVLYQLYSFHHVNPPSTPLALQLPLESDGMFNQVRFAFL